MFTFYQNFNARREENELQREAESTGHDRFCQQRPGAAGRRKRRGFANNRRTQSAIEIECNTDAFATVRSVLLRKEKSEEDESSSRRRHQLLRQQHHGSGGSNDQEAGAAAGAEDGGRGYYQLSSRIDSLAKILFNRVYAVKGYKDQSESTRNNGRQQYMALEQHNQHRLGGEASAAGATGPTTSPSPSSSTICNGAGSGASEGLEMEKRSRDRALSICRIYTRETPRYSLLKHLNNVGSRVDKHWFAVRDTLLKTDRLLTLAPLNRNCSLAVGPLARDVLNKLFLTLQHPYICPILDLEFVKYEGQDYVVLVQPINQGSLKDIIYGIERNCWNEDWPHKYGSRGRGLPISQIQRMGRQVLEALVFLKERDFPTVAHLHSGNVIVQNGAARLAALENTLLGFTSRVHPLLAPRLQQQQQQQHQQSSDDNKLLHPSSAAGAAAMTAVTTTTTPRSIDTVCFGHMLFEMTAGYELCTFEPTAANLSDIQKYPQVVECLQSIFERQTQGSKYPSIEELILHDLFRNIDLREMRNASVNIFRPDTTIPISKILDGIKCHKTPVKRLSNDDSEDMISLSSPESECSENGSLLAQIYKELSITAV